MHFSQFWRLKIPRPGNAGFGSWWELSFGLVGHLSLCRHVRNQASSLLFLYYKSINPTGKGLTNMSSFNLISLLQTQLLWWLEVQHMCREHIQTKGESNSQEKEWWISKATLALPSTPVNRRAQLSRAPGSLGEEGGEGPGRELKCVGFLLHASLLTTSHLMLTRETVSFYSREDCGSERQSDFLQPVLGRGFERLHHTTTPPEGAEADDPQQEQAHRVRGSREPYSGVFSDTPFPQK